MAGFIPEDKLSEVKNASNLVDIVSEVVLLKRAGKDFWGLCPFHSEKTASFKVDPERQAFFCFGCRTGGNVFTFLMKQEGVSFPEAVRILARRLAIEIPENKSSMTPGDSLNQREKVLGANQAGMRFFRQTLMHPSVGKTAREYLNKRRLG
ncbi:MAG: CHC2 zinc finger domain-containing protein, partial [Thermodesulfobacteriota bacterium]